ncbi:MAG: TldD/PmbA family protein [Chloroflexi bacterium]|nr:TldD/PmbA family protein [Chloroflexota bacterium]
MLGERKIREIAGRVFSLAGADQAEALFISFDASLTRFARNSIHQNVSERDASLTVRLVFSKRVGISSTNDLSQDGVRRAVDAAAAIARVVPENPAFPSLPTPAPVPSIQAYVPRTARQGPEERARQAAIICRKAEERGLEAAGVVSVRVTEYAVANTRGVFARHRNTVADVAAVAQSDTSSGYADRMDTDIARIDIEAVADEAIQRAERGRSPVPLDPGEYEVVLEPYATSDILDFLGWVGFSALAVQEGRSFMSGKMGQKVLGENITIWDDGQDPFGIPLPFDFEGVPRQRVELIANGVVKGACYDSYTAARDGHVSTGHAMPPRETFGPLPLNMFMKPGDASDDDLVRSVKRGLLVTRFWYTRTVHPLTVAVTGVTRDGTFLIENGEIARPVRNLRFTQSYVEALNRVQRIGRDTRLVRSAWAPNRVPALKIGAWLFNGVTEY